MNPSYLIYDSADRAWRSGPRAGHFTHNPNEAWRFTRLEAVAYCLRVKKHRLCIPVSEEDAIAAGIKRDER